MCISRNTYHLGGYVMDIINKKLLNLSDMLHDINKNRDYLLNNDIWKPGWIQLDLSNCIKIFSLLVSVSSAFFFNIPFIFLLRQKRIFFLQNLASKVRIELVLINRRNWWIKSAVETLQLMDETLRCISHSNLPRSHSNVSTANR